MHLPPPACAHIIIRVPLTTAAGLGPPRLGRRRLGPHRLVFAAPPHWVRYTGYLWTAPYMHSLRPPLFNCAVLVIPTTQFASPPPSSMEADGSCWYWDLSVRSEGSAYVGLLVHKGEQKAAREWTARLKQDWGGKGAQL